MTSTGELKPGHKIIENVMTANCNPLKACGDQSESYLVEALASFYDTIITIVLALLAVVAGLAIWSVRLISRATAEDIAREATKSVIKDSREFYDDVADTVADQVRGALEEIRRQLEAHEKALNTTQQAVEAVPETEVIKADPEE